MTKEKEQLFDLNALMDEFECPLVNVEPFEVISEKDAAKEIERLENDLKGKSVWKVRYEALNRAMELLKGGIQYYTGGNLASIQNLVAACVTDLRPVMVKQACLFINSHAFILEDDYSDFAGSIVPILLKQVTSSNAQISNSCHLALLGIAHFCQTKTIAKMFLAKSTSQIPAHRQVAAEICHIIRETWTPSALKTVVADVDSVIESLSLDPYALIRDLAVAAGEVPTLQKKPKAVPPSTLPYAPALTKSDKPHPIKTAASPVPSPKPSPKKTPQREPIRVEEEEEEIIEENEVEVSIEEVMPPCNEEQIRLFKSILDQLVSSGQVESLASVVSLIVPSLEVAVSVFADSSHWIKDLTAIYERFAEELNEYVIKVMQIFGFSSWIIELLSGFYSLQALVESMKLSTVRQSQNALKFFVTALQMENPVIQMTKPVITLVEALIKRYGKNTHIDVLKQALSALQQPGDSTEILASLISSLAGKCRWKKPFNNLLSIYNEQDEELLNQIQTSFDSELAQIISSGTDDQRCSAIAFISEASQKFAKISFASVIQALIPILIEEDRSYHSNAISCIAENIGDVKTLAVLLGALENTESAEKVVLDAMLLYFSAAPPQRLLPTEKIVVRKLAPFLSKPDPWTRKQVVLIFAEFRKKIPKEFGKLMKKLSPTQQRLIELYSSK